MGQLEFMNGGIRGRHIGSRFTDQCTPVIVFDGASLSLLKRLLTVFPLVNSSLMLLPLACLLVIPYEGIVFRGFIFSRLRGWFKEPRAYLFSALITSILFALYHYQEGTGAVVQIFIFALLQMVLLKAGQRQSLLCYLLPYAV
jgi:membrane protease YdiL (CAAX protease family)